MVMVPTQTWASNQWKKVWEFKENNNFEEHSSNIHRICWTSFLWNEQDLLQVESEDDAREVGRLDLHLYEQRFNFRFGYWLSHWCLVGEIVPESSSESLKLKLKVIR